MIPIRAYSLQDLLRIYRVSRKTMYNWMKKLKQNPEFSYRKNQALYTPKQVAMIFKELGEPEY